MTRRVSAVIAALILAVTGCAGGVAHAPSESTPGVAMATAGPSDAPPADITVCGASSLASVLVRIKSLYEAAHAGTTLTISTDSSAAFETKIELGAPCDVFLSADSTNPQKLVDKGLASGGPTKLAANLLTVIVPAGNPAGLQTPVDLARRGVKVIAAGDTVPITKYANQLVANLAKQPGYPVDFAARYAANVVSRQDNVVAVVAQVALDEGDAGIVYRTDAMTSTRVITIPVPSTANVQATYAGVVVKASRNTDAARRFLAWLAGPDGQAILASFGFLPAS